MPLQGIQLLPGVNTEVTPTLGQAQIVSSDLIRFKAAGNMVLPEKLGGWQKYYPVSLGTSVMDLHAWEGLNSQTYLAAGCVDSLTIINNGAGLDITPQTITTDPVPSFTTLIGDTTITVDDPGVTTSAFDSIYILVPVAVGGIVLQGGYAITAVLDADSYTIVAADTPTAADVATGAVPEFTTVANDPRVNVELANHGYSVGELFSVPTPTIVGGTTISGSYLVQAVVDADNFTIIVSTLPASNDTQSMNGGNTEIIYFLGLGPAPPGSGYGTGAYGDGAYGTGVVPTPSPGTPITASNWTLDNWGEVLIATPFNGSIYAYSPDSGLPVATRIVGSPLINGGAFVSQPAQILVAWASSQDGVQDPLSINWSDAGDYTNWTVTARTQAGGYRLPTGSRIVGGLVGPSFNIIWTDVDVWAMDYIEPPLIFGFNSLGSGCGLAGLHAATVLNSVTYWVSLSAAPNGTIGGKICQLIGETVSTVPCPVWDYMFQDLDMEHTDLIVAGSNSLFDEVTFFFPSLSGGSGTADSYIKFNPTLGTWDTGRMARSAWVDQSPVGPPVGGTPTGYIFQHEVSRDADGQPMMSWFETGFSALSEGEELTFLDWILPDFKYGTIRGSNGAIIQISLNFTDYPNQPIKTQGPYSVSSTTQWVNSRLRGRLVSMKIASADLGSFWRLGGIKFRGAPDGKR